jgi:molybdopterin-binding protein
MIVSCIKKSGQPCFPFERIEICLFPPEINSPAVVEDIQMGDIMAHVTVKVGESVIESVITRTSAEELALKRGDSVRVVVKSTEVMIQKD